MNDPIVEEVRKARDEYAARFNYDLNAMVADLQAQEKLSGRTFVDYSRKAEKAPPPAGAAGESNSSASPAESTSPMSDAPAAT